MWQIGVKRWKMDRGGYRYNPNGNIPMTANEFFQGYEKSLQLFTVFCDCMKTIGSTTMRISKSQIAFRRKRAFCWIWVPGRCLQGKSAPLVLSVSFNQRHPSGRWKEIVEPYPVRFMHHLEVYSAADIDDEVKGWLRLAWQSAD